MRVLVHKLSFCLAVAAAPSLLDAAATAPVLTTAREVRSLSATAAKEGLPVQLRATVTFVQPPGTVFVQDSTGATFLRTKRPLGGMKEGDLVEISGTTFPGLYLPGVESQAFKIVGDASLPAAQPATLDDLFSGRYHYQLVAVSGIVRSIAPQDENRSTVTIATGNRVLEVQVDEAPPTDAKERLLDAEVAVIGLAAGEITDLRQLVQPYLRASSWSKISITKPALAPAATPLVSADSLLRFNSTNQGGHRVRVKGALLAAFPDGRAFVRDGKVALAVTLDSTTELLPDSDVELVGFPEMGVFSAQLVDGSVLSQTAAPPSEAAAPTRKELLSGIHDADLVTVQGLVAEPYQSASSPSFFVNVEGATFRVESPGQTPPGLPAGSKVQLTGILRVEAVSGKGFNATPTAFALMLRGPTDLVLLHSLSWWTIRRLISALGILASVALAAGVWILLLRRQVARQTLALRDRIQHEAALEERQRIAREFHDTLEQELTGLSLRLDAATTRPMDDKARTLLDTSRNLVTRVQVEARNLVADLRSQPEPSASLPEALIAMADRLQGTQPAVALEIQPGIEDMQPHIVHHLRMIAQEGITNALKHSSAEAIEVRVTATPAQLELAILDNGRGLHADQETAGKPGHFGCMGIRERCRKIGARVEWLPHPDGRGTKLTVTLPRSNA